MLRAVFQDAKQYFSLKKLDIGDLSVISRRGMCFHVHVFDAKNAGRLFLMNMKAFGGLIKMETATFTPLELDAPIFSTDEVLAFGKSTLVLELYDTTITHPDFHPLDDVKQKYADLPAYIPEDRPYFSLHLPECDFKQGRGIKERIRSMAKEYSQAYFLQLEQCPSANLKEKKVKNAIFTDSLYQNGGMAVNQFKKMIGEEKTKKFLMEYMFCSE